jgi:hypothetical protein
MAVRRYRFDSFSLDPIERRLFAGEVLVELNSRYFDALLLFLQHPVGALLGRRYDNERAGRAWFNLCLVGAPVLARR